MKLTRLKYDMRTVIKRVYKALVKFNKFMEYLGEGAAYAINR